MNKFKRDNRANLFSSRKLEEDVIVSYLLQHPDFFVRHASKLENVVITHSVKGAVSLVEWQLIKQREQISILKKKMAMLVDEAIINERLIAQLVILQVQLTQAKNFEEFLTILRQWAKNLGLRSAYLRFTCDRWDLTSLSLSKDLVLSQSNFYSLQKKYLNNVNHYLGKLSNNEISLLFPGETPLVGSVALSLLGDFGLLIFVSEDSEHYQEGMETTLLQQLTILLTALLEHWIKHQ